MIHDARYLKQFEGKHSSLLAHHPYERDAWGELEWTGICQWCEEPIADVAEAKRYCRTKSRENARFRGTLLEEAVEITSPSS